MITGASRFHGHHSIDGVYRRGQTLRGAMMNLKFQTGRDLKVAVVVSKKVSKSAVARNRIRRRVYELVRQYDQAELARLQLVFIIYSDHLASIESPRLKAAVHDLLKRTTSQ